MDFNAESTVLFRRVNGSLKQIIKIDLSGEVPEKDNLELILNIRDTVSKFDLRDQDLKIGGQPSYYIEVPEIIEDVSAAAVLVHGGSKTEKELLLKKRRRWEVHLQTFTHTDFGYTDLPSNIPGEYEKFLKEVIDYCDETKDFDELSRFRWNTESGSWLELAIKSISDAELNKFVDLAREGRIELQPFYEPHVSEYYDEEILIRSLYFAFDFARKNNLKIETAVATDVPGLPWLLPQILNRSGIKYLTTASNTYMAKPLDIERPFYWEYLDGSRVLLYEADRRFQYQEGPMLGFSSNYIEALKKLPVYLLDLEKDSSSFKYDLLSLRAPGTLGDNTPPNISMSYIAKEWNNKWEYPKIVVSTFTKYFKKFEEKYGRELKNYRASWPNWWASCNAAAAYEAGVNRYSSSDIMQGEKLYSVAGIINRDFDKYPKDEISRIYSKMLHTHESGWGANVSVLEPYSLQSRGQRFENASLVYQVSINSKKILEDSKKQFSIPGPSKDKHNITVFNTMSWKRSGIAEAVIPSSFIDGDRTIEIVDPDSGEKLPYQIIDNENYEKNIHDHHLGRTRLAVRVDDIPPLGFKTLDILESRVSKKQKPQMADSGGVIENKFYKLKFDQATGNIISLVDKESSKNIICNDSGYAFNQFIYETPSRKRNLGLIEFFSQDNVEAEVSGEFHYFEDSLKEKFKEYYNYPARDMELLRTSPDDQKLVSVKNGDIFSEITTMSSSKMFPEIKTTILLDNYFKRVIVKNYLFKLETLDAEAAYFVFPFNIKEPTIKMNCHGGHFEPEAEQLPGSAKDWYCIQKWMDIYDNNTDITWTPIEAPLVQLGEINTGRWLDKLEIKSATIISYLLNNYWITNTPPNQGGKLWFNYQFTSNNDTFDPVRSNKFGWDALNPIETYFDSGIITKKSESMGGLIADVPENVFIMGLKKSEIDNGIILRLLEVSGRGSEFYLEFCNNNIKEAYEVSPVEDFISKLEFNKQGVKLMVKPYELKTIKIYFT